MNFDPTQRLQSIVPHDPKVVQLVQFTDCHIYAAPEANLRGLNTRRSFEAVKAAALATDQPLDLVLATGDLSQDGSAESYAYLAAQFTQCPAPTFWIPGNHDELATLATHFRGPQIQPENLIAAGHWLVVLLDSTLPGKVYGSVAEDQLEFMETALCAHRERHALVCLHHQAQPTGSNWIDQKGLRDDDRFRARLRRHKNLRGVLWGHVHQEFHQSIGGVEWMSTPSSCIQFMPGADEFTTDPQAPGFRRLALHDDGWIETRVERVDGKFD